MYKKSVVLLKNCQSIADFLIVRNNKEMHSNKGIPHSNLSSKWGIPLFEYMTRAISALNDLNLTFELFQSQVDQTAEVVGVNV